MGRAVESRTISVSLSRHNSDRDKRDDEMFDRLLEEVAELCRKYPEIQAEVW